MIVLSWNIRGLNDPVKDLQSKNLITFVYGLHTIHDRMQLWTGLKGLPSASIPWLCVADFNFVLSVSDRLNGAAVSEYETRDFQQCIDDLALVEIKSKGSFYSWGNKAHSGPRTFTRIDRGLVNQAWINFYGHVEALYLPPSLSDHSPLVFNIFQPQPGKGKPFRFLNYLAEHENFMSSVEGAWQSSHSKNAMNVVWCKLKQVKGVLKTLNIQKFGDIHGRVEDACNQLSTVQHQISGDEANTDLYGKEMEAIANVKYWLRIQESIYKQKSRVDWM
ncbi:uncharacterized protein LOC110733686 [Chenopodium quinoa]|uniref:uncharacterized protein LOC110733686 n=1 Tax=Chenopodium quinoa TaxID=63459 RepID=UPI000B787464|nr:uncharacterized protein LOC110733686 [Chenopodium quinoa]